jgi:hypothetical protein
LRIRVSEAEPVVRCIMSILAKIGFGLKSDLL